jgi:hypothetical protein
MRRNHLTIVFALLLVLPLFAQKNTVEGIVADSTGTALPAATIFLMQRQDSVLASFGTSDNEGHFLLKRVAPGDYLLQVTYVGYQTHWLPLSVVPDAGKVDAGRIVLSPAGLDLDAVEVTGEHVPLRLKKDTIEYNAAAFKTQPGSVVEDLLKKLPGVEVDRDGNIKAHGETVQNVLVEGKEFFGKDPKIATKNLPADAVDKVQVFDKKSEIAEFTGIEDGRDEKTINLALKEGKKQGCFGNASLGGGAMEQPAGGYDFDRYQGKFNINRFSKTTQLSAIGMANNINEQGFSFDDYIRFMGGLSNLASTSGGGGKMKINLQLDGGMPMGGMGLNRGLTDTRAGGLNLNHDFSKKTKLSASYFFNQIENDLESTSTRESLLGDSNFKSAGSEDHLSRNANHRLSATLRYELDSFQNIVLRSNFSFNDAHLERNSGGMTFNSAGSWENENTRLYNSNGENLSFNSSLSYRRRFRQPGRAFVADLSFGMSDDERRARQNSLNTFFQNQAPFFDTLNQRQFFTDNALNYGANLSFTEPLGKGKYLELNASRQNYANETVKDFYDLLPTDGERYNDTLSMRFNRGYLYDRGGLNFMFNRKKFKLTAGAALQRSKLDGTLPGKNLELERSFTRLLPSLFFNYEFGTSRHLDFEYSTNLREPSLEQLQPVVDNSDPLNVYAGNPNLRPEYEHSASLRYFLFDQFTFTSLFANIDAGFVKDRIVNSSTVDSLFRRFITPLNVNRDLTLQGNIDFGTPLRFIKTNLRLNLSSFWNKGIVYVNGIENDVERLRNSLDLSFDNRKKGFVDVTAGGRLSFNRTSYSVNESLNQNWLDKRLYADLILTPGKQWEFGSSFDLVVYSAETFGSESTVPIWKAHLIRYILKNNRGQIKLSAFDLLNRNIGIDRSSRLEYVQEERTRSLGRFVMLTFGYSISGFGAEKGGIEIKMSRRE